jgi:DWNN domain
MSVRYKFKNDLEFHSIPCDGLNISLRDLKRAIIRANKLGKVTDFDLLGKSNPY